MMEEFSATRPRFAGTLMRVQENPKAMVHALAFFRLLSWEELSSRTFPIRGAKFVSPAQFGFPVVVLLKIPDIDWGEIQLDQIQVFQVRDPQEALATIVAWAAEKNLEINTIQSNKKACLFTLDDVFVSQIMLVPFR